MNALLVLSITVAPARGRGLKLDDDNWDMPTEESPPQGGVD